jgi:hypothetical protein
MCACVKEREREREIDACLRFDLVLDQLYLSVVIDLEVEKQTKKITF